MTNDDERKRNAGNVLNRIRFGSRATSIFRHLLIRHSTLLTGILVGFALLAGCTTQSNRKWLRFFFDGVPGSGPATNAPAIVYDEDGRPLEQTPAVHKTVAAAKIAFTAHPPYEDKQCSECHESRFSVKMKAPQKQVCFTCHDDFLEKAKFKHQPAENGECSSCHDPHGSALPKMLVQTGQMLCATCHDPLPAGAKSKHLPVENGECLSCHNAHASDQKALLLKPAGKLCFECHEDTQKQLLAAKVRHQPVENGECSGCHSAHQSVNKKLLLKPDGKLCFECHDDFQKKLESATFKHDPVGNGDCASCHNSHQSSEPGLLTKGRRQLCFECHEEKDMAAVKAHAPTLQKSCIECHDPHLGKDKFLLKATSEKSGEAK